MFCLSKNVTNGAVILNAKDGQLYITNSNGKAAKEISTILGVLEAIDILSFEMTGGANSQLYILTRYEILKIY